MRPASVVARSLIAGACGLVAAWALAAPAAATVVWQETFAPDPSGQTLFGFGVGPAISLLAPQTRSVLTISGGTIADIAWTSSPIYTTYFWEQLPPETGPWLLLSDTAPAGQGIETITTSPTASNDIFDANDFNVCLSSGYHQLAVCGAELAGGTLAVDGLIVDASSDFTLTLSTSYGPVPEAPVWALMLTGVGLLGLALRSRRRDPVRR